MPIEFVGFDYFAPDLDMSEDADLSARLVFGKMPAFSFQNSQELPKNIDSRQKREKVSFLRECPRKAFLTISEKAEKIEPTQLTGKTVGQTGAAKP